MTYEYIILWVNLHLLSIYILPKTLPLFKLESTPEYLVLKSQLVQF